MKWINFVAFLIILVLAGCSCSNQSDVDKSGAETLLTLDIRLHKSEYCLGEPVVATVSLTNIGHDLLLINSRMSLHKTGLPSPMRELVFYVTTPQGESYDPILYASPKYYEKKYFINLKPDDVFEFDFHFASNFYTFPEIGVYKIVANYQNLVDPNYIDSSDARIAWKGELNSNEVLLEIVPCTMPSVTP
jgi:hypothetical protein